MTASIALLLSLAQAPTAPAARLAPPAEARAIVAAMLDYETGAYPSDPSQPTCVIATLDAPLHLEREDREDFDARARRGRAPEPEFNHDWALPEPRPDPRAPMLEEARAHRLDHLVAAALAALPRRAGRGRGVAPESVHAPLILGRRPDCRFHIGLAAPFLVDDVAFIEANFESGGNLYALERRGGHWTVFALASMWVF